MKHLLAATFVMLALLVASNSHAAMTWSWSFDQLAGTFTTAEAGYMPGTYTLDDFAVTQVGTTGFPAGGFEDMTWIKGINSPYTFSWDGTEASNFLIPCCGAGWVMVDSATMNYVIGFGDETDGLLGTWVDAANNGANPVKGPLTIAPVPIPATALLFASGLIGLVWKGRKARKSAV
jgi:hypothetical protein